MKRELFFIIFLLNLGPPFVYLPLLQIEKNNTSPLGTPYMLVPQIIPLSTLTLVRTLYEESTTGAFSRVENWKTVKVS